MTDREVIVNLLARYAQSVDRRDFDAVAACFTHDIRAVYNDTRLGPGVDKVLEYIRAVARFPASQHVLGSIEVEVDGDRATSRAHAITYLVSPSQSGHVLLTRGISYDDQWVRTDGGW